MCYLCDGGTPDELERRIARRIQQTGWSIMGVERRNGQLHWAYTIGLSERFDHPELVVTGRCCFVCAEAMLGQAAHRVATGARLEVGDELGGLGSPVRVGAVHPAQWRGDRFAAWHEHYRRTPGTSPEQRAVQLLWVDDDGIWQDDPRRGPWLGERLDRPSPIGARGGQPRSAKRRRDRRRPGGAKGRRG